VKEFSRILHSLRATSHSVHRFLGFLHNTWFRLSLWCWRHQGMPIPSSSIVSICHQLAGHRSDQWELDSSYPLALFNLLISGGLLLLYTNAFKSYDWKPPFQACKSAVVFFFLSNVFLVVVPMIPPSTGYEPYEHLPYYVSCWLVENKDMN